ATLDAAEPWGLALDAVPGAAFHAVTDGLAWLRIPRRPDTRLMPGDVVLLPPGIAHIPARAPHAATVPLDHLPAAQALAAGPPLPTRPSTRPPSPRHTPPPATTGLSPPCPPPSASPAPPSPAASLPRSAAPPPPT